jgi:hypothetical protein
MHPFGVHDESLALEQDVPAEFSTRTWRSWVAEADYVRRVVHDIDTSGLLPYEFVSRGLAPGFPRRRAKGL